MGDDNLGALHIGDVVMRVVSPVLVLSKIHRIGHLTDVMVQGTCTRQQRIATDGIQHLVTQIGYLDGVLEGTRRSLCQLTEQRRVGVIQLHQRQRSGQTEHLLKQEDQWQREHREKGIQRQQTHDRPIDGRRSQESKRHVGCKIGDKEQYRREEIVPTRLVA